MKYCGALKDSVPAPSLVTDALLPPLRVPSLKIEALRARFVELPTVWTKIAWLPLLSVTTPAFSPAAVPIVPLPSARMPPLVIVSPDGALPAAAGTGSGRLMVSPPLTVTPAVLLRVRLLTVVAADIVVLDEPVRTTL